MIIGISIFVTLFLILLYALIFKAPKHMKAEKERLENLDEFYVNKSGRKITLEELVQKGYVLQDEIYNEEPELNVKETSEFIYSQISYETKRKISIVDINILIELYHEHVIEFTGTSLDFVSKVRPFIKEYGINLLNDELEMIFSLVDV